MDASRSSFNCFPTLMRGSFPLLQETLRVEPAVHLDHLRHQPGPTGLVARPKPAPLSPWKYS